MKLVTVITVLLLVALLGCSGPKVDFEAENKEIIINDY